MGAGVFPGSQVTNVTTLRDTPSGDCDVVSFRVWGHEFMALSGGPQFKINPSISFIVNFDSTNGDEPRQRLDRIWAQLAEGGNELMPLGEYPFSKRYGWIEDRFGVSWQITPADLGEMISAGTPEQIARVPQAFLPMKKFDLAQLQSAYESAD
jgi:predicted 3-demethylubiquinone-9 3-methyltransferase (glyoxalase superfamily)